MTSEFEHKFNTLLMDMRYRSQQVPMNSWQSQDVQAKPGMSYSKELQHVTFRLGVPGRIETLQEVVKPNLPWAEDHFLERVGGWPLNPPPSEAWWPFRVQQNAEHKEVEGEKFSHTYPERMWPRYANDYLENFGCDIGDDHDYEGWRGIRYRLGDLDDLVELIVRDPLTRQAYLPIWFPEDTGAHAGQRVPCTLGYHFILRPSVRGHYDADIVYYIRSCDLFRHFTDDVYMACRLLQWVVGKARDRGINADGRSLIMHITSLHIFEGDEFRLKQLTDKIFDEEEPVYGSAV